MKRLFAVPLCVALLCGIGSQSYGVPPFDPEPPYWGGPDIGPQVREERANGPVRAEQIDKLIEQVARLADVLERLEHRMPVPVMDAGVIEPKPRKAEGTPVVWKAISEGGVYTIRDEKGELVAQSMNSYHTNLEAIRVAKVRGQAVEIQYFWAGDKGLEPDDPWGQSSTKEEKR